MTNRAFRIAAVIICLLVLLPAALAACQNPDYVYNAQGEVECGGNGQPVILHRNPKAVNPTFNQLVDFIEKDQTDQHPYIVGQYVCADFATAVYNNAEAAGIRAGWVGISFNGTDVGHAVDAFQTTDRGLVYIDCTNGESSDPQHLQRSWDMIAYVEVGKPYGVIPLDRIIANGADGDSLTYAYYAQREAAWQNYATELDTFNSSVTAFNTATAGRTFIIGTAAYDKMTSWKDQLQAQQKDLEAYQNQYGTDWYQSEYSSYTVSDIAVHW